MNLPEAGKPEIGRNEPCPCKSGKKYKRCCGVSAAPKLGAPKAMPQMPQGADNPFAGMDPAMMQQMAQMVQRLPRGQMQKLQSIMQRAMSGKDVSREAAEFEKTLPPNFQEMMKGFQLPPEMMEQMGAAAGGLEELTPDLIADASGATPEQAAMSAEEARAIVAKAAAEGKITAEQAETLLKAGPAADDASPAPSGGIDATPEPVKKGFKFWKK